MSTAGALEDRTRLAKAMNDMLMQDYVMIPLIHRGGVAAHANSLGGVAMNARAVSYTHLTLPTIHHE